ncbi:MULTISPECIES: C40 family peptidase [Roseobacteraceae]|uniref:His-Xaa-Ser repeat protein HxsA n=3 Tax=Roseobacteraceae TaxID=2854170 RepID=A0A0U1NNS6_9RHOB|nr:MULTISPECIES: TIGR02594 family protein [Roseobacteraceae]CRK76352.1 His-Xaa-Ser repeat protein HxsA [Nereida ignava]CUH61467.1 His-Xaa-Ser repeat protein HxsA [Thalassobacter stenotrophicus]SFJ79309.1 TIGR02594 family protein [Nereida ignava DSM 16309]SHJ09133.1 TIGR02594 family protein [Thalassobacter stenotrophicus DSM 16310]
MTPFDIARSYIGTTEGPGPADNPVIMEMYASVGHDWVEHDSVAWCAAFVGHCLEKAGIKSTRKLTARSYLDWGIPIEVADAQQGDIGVIPRGSSSWQGHVFFIDRIEGAWVWGLGGNQDDAVNVKRYPVSKLLGVRRAGNVAPSVTMSVEEVQGRLKELGYHEVGQIDGKIGPRTRAAILAFRQDNDLALVPIIDVALTEALEDATPREITPDRASGAPAESRIVTASNAQIGLGVIGAAGSIGSQIAPALMEAEEVRDMAGRVLTLIGLENALSNVLPWIGAAVFIGVVIYALRAKAARIDDHRTGKTP